MGGPISPCRRRSSAFGRSWDRSSSPASWPAFTLAHSLTLGATALGLILLIVPGLILLTWWILIIPVIVLEQRRAGESFSRSRELVRGYGWSVFGVIVLTILLIIAFYIVLSLILLPAADWLRSFVQSVVGGAVTTPFIVTAWTLLYYRLKAAKETPPAAPAQAPIPPPAT